MQIMYQYQPELAASALPNKLFKPVLGPLRQLSLILAPPAVHGFRGCSCFAGYMSVVTFDDQGLLRYSNTPADW